MDFGKNSDQMTEKIHFSHLRQRIFTKLRNLNLHNQSFSKWGDKPGSDHFKVVFEAFEHIFYHYIFPFFSFYEKSCFIKSAQN